MPERKLGAVETRFAEIVWRAAPLPSRELVRLCEDELGWNRSTTYTVLRKLCQRGLFSNEDGTVRVVVPRQEFYDRQSEAFVEETFGGSLPAFIAAFTRRKPLSPDEAEEIRRMIEAAKGE